MNRIKRIILFSALGCMLLSIGAVSTMAASSQTLRDKYDTTERTYFCQVLSDYGKSCTLSIDTRPIIGQDGVIVSYERPDGRVIQSRLFPYYTDIPPMVVTLESAAVRRIYVEPSVKGQRVMGYLEAVKTED